MRMRGAGSLQPHCRIRAPRFGATPHLRGPNRLRPSQRFEFSCRSQNAATGFTSQKAKSARHIAAFARRAALLKQEPWCSRAYSADPLTTAGRVMANKLNPSGGCPECGSAIYLRTNERNDVNRECADCGHRYKVRLEQSPASTAS